MVIDYRKIINIIIDRGMKNKLMLTGKDKKLLTKLTEWEDNETA